MTKRIWACALLVALMATLMAAPAMAAETSVARCDVRIRKQASTTSDTLTVIVGGTEVTVLGTSGSWTKVSYGGYTGYVSSNYLMELTRSGYYPLKEGDENPYVRELQKRLIELGYMTGSANGEFNEATLAAVKAFQKNNKMKQDGIAGGETQRVMFSDAAKAASGVTAPVSTGSTPDTTASTASTGTTSSSTLRLGDRGEDVKTLQARLIELGYLSGKADGIFGASTQTAVVNFQKRSSLTADGKAGKVTQNLLYSTGATPAEGVTVATNSAATAGAEYSTLKRGMTSSSVKKLQQALIDLGYLKTNATGYYGSATQLAVEAFQKANNLASDGVAGSATQKQLYSSSAKPVSSPASSTAATATQKYDTLKFGMKSAAVTTMQKKLKSLGYLSANATGYFGEATKTAVIAFQKANNLSTDGVAGNATLQKLYSDTAASSGSSASSSSSASSGVGKISGPSASQVKLLHWFNSVRPSLKNGAVVQVYDPASGYGFKLKALSLGNHFDSEPLTAEDTLYMNAAFGNVSSWTPKPVYVQLTSGTWVLATMHNVPHLSGNIANNNFDGHLCVHFLRDMAECQKNDPNYGVQHQKAIRDAWKKLTGETVN